MYTQDDKIQAGIRRQMINEGTIQPMGRTYGNMSMGQGKPNWVADRSPVQQGLKSIDDKLYSAIVMMVMVTTMMTPPLIKWSLNKKQRKLQTNIALLNNCRSKCVFKIA